MDLVKTGDGSHTLYVPDLDEHYHSAYGAVAESLHVFINTGLNALPVKGPITIFEVGFGTGLNALLTCVDSIKTKRPVLYYAIEKNPLDVDQSAELNYPGFIKDVPDPRSIFLSVHTAPWNQTVVIQDNFRLHKIHKDLTAFLPDFKCDLIYFDAFAPEKQPEMWTQDIFFGLYNCLNPGGIITTYCVKGYVKRMLKQAGFLIEKLPGPPGKREILRGWRRV